MSKQHIASSIDDFLKKEGFEQAPGGRPRLWPLVFRVPRARFMRALCVPMLCIWKRGAFSCRLLSRAVMIHPQRPRSRLYDTGVHREPVLPPKIASLI